ncbi:hypothetical protein BOTBODRAFT_176740 [Botryobasidium botryosum FD-172 SS1]|uniref:Uncharacterized protein n=1 Tax=Botryobasidium botryosum (strain FD-172 SS1) TaxID=930990 RepID=A0A067M858_BOTB1|nr:hypothetical protein BOTBODRAFT_176740 [Botryobasidium botryosum FD-172 SS1]
MQKRTWKQIEKLWTQSLSTSGLLPENLKSTRPPTYVPESFTKTAPSHQVATRRFKQLLTQAFTNDLEENIPQDHIFRTFDLLQNPEDTRYPSFIDLCHPARETALLARIASGHCKVGSYFLKMHIDELEAPIACPCGTIDIQTISHVISKCLITALTRHLLKDDDGEINTATLFTNKLDPFLKWLKATHAFTRHFGEALGPVSPRPAATDLVGFSIVFTTQLPAHSIRERTHAANLALVGTLRNLPAHLLTPDIALVIANRAIINGLTNPSRRTVYHSHLHDLASRAILACPTTLHIFVINKFHTLHPPKSAFYYRPPTYIPELFTEMAPSHCIATRCYKQLLAQAFAEDLKENIPQDHMVHYFDLLCNPVDTRYLMFIDLHRPARETALLARIASGHCKVGSYFLKMHIDKPEALIACPCGTTNIQTVAHVISKCPIMAPADTS